MRPVRRTEAHLGAGLAELVCSNSFRSDDTERNAVGLLHEEMRRCGSLILAAADRHKVPAGGALAVDRVGFSERSSALTADPLIEIRREEIAGLPPPDWDEVIIATGPLTSPALAEALSALTGEDKPRLFRRDRADRLSRDDRFRRGVVPVPLRQGRRGQGRLHQLPARPRAIRGFVAALLAGEKTEFHEWEKSTPYFDGCLPVEIMAGARPDTLRWGPMKPVGLTDPRTGRAAPRGRPAAPGQCIRHALQHGRISDEAAAWRADPHLPHDPRAGTRRFARLGGLHRNTFINSPRLLDGALRLKAMPRLRFAGQITGVEGYVESAAIGLLAGIFAASARLGHDSPPPATTALGALLRHITGGAESRNFQPMNVNFGLFPPLSPDPGRRADRKPLVARRALADLAAWRALDRPTAG